MSKRVVRAQLKPLAELPEEFVCCEAMRQAFIATSGDVLQAMPDSLFEAEVECRYCHRILRDVKYVRIRRNKKKPQASCIAVPCYEFDEGTIR